MKIQWDLLRLSCSLYSWSTQIENLRNSIHCGGNQVKENYLDEAYVYRNRPTVRTLGIPAKIDGILGSEGVQAQGLGKRRLGQVKVLLTSRAR